MTPPRRCWSFRLRTLLVVVGVLACAFAWLTWQVKIVNDRKALREWIQTVDPNTGKPTAEKLPWVRRILGDEPFAEEIALPSDTTDARWAEIRRLVPESSIGRWVEEPATPTDHP